jgi:hypothetical protein
MEEVEILNELQSSYPHIISVNRLQRRDRDSNTLIKTGSVKIDFNVASGSPLPDRLFLFYEAFSCDLFVRNPLRCTKCQSFGHTTSSCRSNKIKCAKCGGSHRTDDCVTQNICCPNCKGDHPAFSRACPKFTLAQNIEIVSASKRISYSDAIKVIHSSHTGTKSIVKPANLKPVFFPPLPQTQVTLLNPAITTLSQAPPSPSLRSIDMNAIATNATYVSKTTDPVINSDTSIIIPNPCPSLSDICPPEDLKNFILDIHNLFQRRLKDQPLKASLVQLINNFFNPRLRRTASSASSTKSS